jgi:hypothetical protein
MAGRLPGRRTGGAVRRISYRRDSLDAALSSLGISPHPGVVLVVEGETEEFLVPTVRDHIRIPKQAEVIQSVVLRGVGSHLTKARRSRQRSTDRTRTGSRGVASGEAATILMVVVDPGKGFESPDAVSEQRRKIVDEIVAVVRAQGVEPDRAEIESLIEVTTWTEGCFEFEHFTDVEGTVIVILLK